MTRPTAEEVARAVTESPKYRCLSRETVDRIAAWAVARSPSRAGAVKRAKRKLHEVHGAYLGAWDPRRVEELLFSPRPSGDAAVRDACREILSRHASTRERLPILDSFYRRIFEITGVPRRLLDVGCGLAPFALPWMSLPKDCEYVATEIDARIVSLVNRLFETESQKGAAHCRDVLAAIPDGEFDVVLLLKMLPTLERQQKGCAGPLLRALDARFVVVSFPVLSLGGRKKGMPHHYRKMMDRALDLSPRPAVPVELEGELLFVVDKNSP